MDIKVDWLAFTVPVVSPALSNGAETRNFLVDAVDRFTNHLCIPVAGWREGEVDKGRGFYSFTVIDEKTKSRISWGDINRHIYCEVTSVACDLINAGGRMNDLLHSVASRCSRIDIAGDLYSDQKVSGMIGNHYKAGRVSHAYISSPQGDTAYVGSRKSERFLRVYRYHPPHPRSATLRIEHEFKGKLSRTVCERVFTEGLRAVYESACNSYHWDNEAWRDGEWTLSKIPSTHMAREDAGRLLWAYHQVLPGLASLYRDGLIDLSEFFETLLQHVKEDSK